MTIDLDQLDSLHAAATPGEWFLNKGFSDWNLPKQHDICAVETPEHERDLVAGVPSITPNPMGGKKVDREYAARQNAAAECIVALHNAWPAVSAELREARARVAQLEALRTALKKIAGSWGWLNSDKEARREMLNIAVSALDALTPEKPE